MLFKCFKGAFWTAVWDARSHSLTFFWRFSFVTNKDLTSRSDKLVQQSGSSPKSVLSHQFPCLCLLTMPGHFVFPFSPLQIVDTFDRLLPPAEGLKQCWRRAVKNNTSGAVVTSRWSFRAFARVEKARTVLNVILVLKKCPSSILRHWIRGVVLLPQCDPSPTAVRENLRLCYNRPVGPRRSKWPRWAQPPTSPGRCGIAKPNSTDGPCQDLPSGYLT